MKVQAKAGAAFAALDDSDAGEGLAIFFSQSATDGNRWKLDVYARLDTGADCLVGSLFVSPPAATLVVGPTSRQVGAAVCPGAKSWSVIAATVTSSIVAAEESANITLSSSPCCTAPVGVSRVGERYGASSGTGNSNLNLLQGRTVTAIHAFGLGGGGLVVIDGTIGVTVAAGQSVKLEPQALLQIRPAGVIAFTNVNWIVEFKESA